MTIFRDAMRGIEYYFNLLKYLYHLTMFYAFKIIFNSGVLISILSSSFILAMFFDGNVNFLQVYAENMSLDFKGLLPYLVLSFILLISYEIARYHFKAIYFTGVEVDKRRETKQHFYKRMIGFDGVLTMTLILIGSVYLANTIIGDRISKKLNSEIMSSYKTNVEVVRNNKRVGILNRACIYQGRILRSKNKKVYNIKSKRKARNKLNRYKAEIRSLKTQNNKILNEIISTKKDIYKSKRNGAFILSVVIEIFSIISFLMDLVVFKYGDMTTRANIKTKYRIMNNKLIKSNILPPKLIRQKKTEQNPFLS